MQTKIPNELADRIIDSVDIAEHISQYIPLKRKGADEYFACCPFHSESTPSFSVTPNKNLFYCFGCKASGNVITFEQMYNGLTFSETVEKLSKQYGIDRSIQETSPSILLMRKLNKAKEQPKQRTAHTILPHDYMERYADGPASEWLREGITEKTQRTHGVRIDVSGNRIIYPVYDVNGNLINIKGRTRSMDYKILGIPKYINYFKVGELDYFQGFVRNKNAVLSTGEAIIFESYKSVMKAEQYGMMNTLSAETSSLSMAQIKLLLAMHCNVTIAFDNDIRRADISKITATLKRFTNVYIIEDKEKLLGEPKDKMSPADKGKDIWETLYKNKIKIL